MVGSMLSDANGGIRLKSARRASERRIFLLLRFSTAFGVEGFTDVA
ncbi:MAG: hypothetical protein QM627_10880 [Luteolibacter sp.]